jgi:hypothetical protein
MSWLSLTSSIPRSSSSSQSSLSEVLDSFQIHWKENMDEETAISRRMWSTHAIRVGVAIEKSSCISRIQRSTCNVYRISGQRATCLFNMLVYIWYLRNCSLGRANRADASRQFHHNDESRRKIFIPLRRRSRAGIIHTEVDSKTKAHTAATAVIARREGFLTTEPAEGLEFVYSK